jgi:2-hydroxy-6-oxonona-2,4-dienedioate hydrolase
MPATSLFGHAVQYELLGEQGPLVVLNPGGRCGMDHVRPLALQLAPTARVLLWDRPNLGGSDLCFEGATDLDMWSDHLHALLTQLRLGPAVLAAASSGARLSMRMALRYPQAVEGLFLWLLSGGPVAKVLARNYYLEPAEVAEQQGMAAVAALPYWRARIRANPANLQCLLAQQPDTFAATLRRWAQGIREDQPIIGMEEGELARITARTRVVAGSDDASHQRDRMLAAARQIPGAELIDPPGFREEWIGIRQSVEVGTGFESISMLPALINDFIGAAGR